MGPFRGYQTSQFKLSNVISRPELSVQAYGRVSGDFQDERPSDPTYRLYHVFLKWNDPNERFRVTVGRQTVFAGVAVGRVDGLRMRLTHWNRVRLDVFGGALVSGGAKESGHLPPQVWPEPTLSFGYRGSQRRDQLLQTES